MMKTQYGSFVEEAAVSTQKTSVRSYKRPICVDRDIWATGPKAVCKRLPADRQDRSVPPESASGTQRAVLLRRSHIMRLMLKLAIAAVYLTVSFAASVVAGPF